MVLWRGVFNLFSGGGSDTTPMLLTPVGSAEFMAPEIVEAFIEDNEMDLKYDKRWKFGIVMQYLVLLFYSFTDAKLDQKKISYLSVNILMAMSEYRNVLLISAEK